MYYLTTKHDVEILGIDNKFDIQGAIVGERVWCDDDTELMEKINDLLDDYLCQYDELDDVWSNSHYLPTISVNYVDDYFIKIAEMHSIDTDGLIGQNVIDLNLMSIAYEINEDKSLHKLLNDLKTITKTEIQDSFDRFDPA